MSYGPVTRRFGLRPTREEIRSDDTLFIRAWRPPWPGPHEGPTTQLKMNRLLVTHDKGVKGSKVGELGSWLPTVGAGAIISNSITEKETNAVAGLLGEFPSPTSADR